MSAGLAGALVGGGETGGLLWLAPALLGSMVLATGVWGVWWLMKPILEAARSRAASSCPSEYVFHDPSNGASGEPCRFPRPGEEPSKLLSVVVPAYNEELRLPAMLDFALDYLREQADKDSSYTYEVLVVDDGSTDGTAALVDSYTKRLGPDAVRLLRLRGNQGKGSAVKKGMLRSRGRYLLMADADAATDIEDLGHLLARLKQVQASAGGELHGVAVGSRAHLQDKAVATRAFHRTVLMFGFHVAVALLCSRKVQDTQCGFKLFTRDTARVLFTTLRLDRWAFDVELVYLCDRLHIPMTEVAVNWREVPGSKLITSKLDVITTSAAMLRDMVCVNLCYTLGLWRVTTPPAPGLPGATAGASVAAAGALEGVQDPGVVVATAAPAAPAAAGAPTSGLPSPPPPAPAPGPPGTRLKSQ